MAGEDQEKTEEPTSKKIEDARKDGNVPKSQDLAGFVTIAVAIFVVVALLGFIKDQFFMLYNYYQDLIGQEFTRKLLFSVTIITAHHPAHRRLYRDCGRLRQPYAVWIYIYNQALGAEFKQNQPVKRAQKSLFAQKADRRHQNGAQSNH